MEQFCVFLILNFVKVNVDGIEQGLNPSQFHTGCELHLPHHFLVHYVYERLARPCGAVLALSSADLSNLK